MASPKTSDHTHDAVIVGAGPGGICAAIELQASGVSDFVLLERSDRLGGTWALNRYPGLECDIASHLYSFSFELKRDWTRPYATQPEIHDYLEHTARKYGVVDRILRGTSVLGATWDDARSLWTVTTGTGEEVRGRVLISAVGMFNGLSWPEIPGLDTFRGTCFHSGRWDHDHDLTGETVAVVGTAASAVQFIPEIAEVVGRLVVYQRSAQWVLPKADAPYTPEQIAGFMEGDTAERFRERVFREVDAIMTFSDPGFLAKCTQDALENLAVVEDETTRAELAPSVPYGCQRPLQSNRYYPTFNRPNVELVTEPIRSIEEHAIVTDDGRSRLVDTIILATGYTATRFASALDLVGRGGSRLRDAWATGAHAYLGIATHGFPNFFMLYGPNTNNGSIIYMLECQARYIARKVCTIRDEHLEWLDVRDDVERAYVDEITEDLAKVEVWGAACNNYYRAPSGRIVTQWPHSMTEYRRRTERPDDDAYETGAGALTQR